MEATLTNSTWSEALAGFEERILVCRSLLADDLDASTLAYLEDLTTGESVATPATLARFVPPVGLGPLPPELSARARAVVDAGSAVAAELGARRDEVLERLRALSSRRAAYPASGREPPRPRLLDQHG